MEQSHTPINYSAAIRKSYGLPVDASDAELQATREARNDATGRGTPTPSALEK